jgi:hypothetical protein
LRWQWLPQLHDVALWIEAVQEPAAPEFLRGPTRIDLTAGSGHNRAEPVDACHLEG